MAFEGWSSWKDISHLKEQNSSSKFQFMESYLLQVWKLKFKQVGSKGNIWNQIYSCKIRAQFTETQLLTIVLIEII